MDSFQLHFPGKKSELENEVLTKGAKFSTKI